MRNDYIMYAIRKTDRLSSTKSLIYKITSLGLGIAALQSCVELLKIFQHMRNSTMEKDDHLMESSIQNVHLKAGVEFGKEKASSEYDHPMPYHYDPRVTKDTSQIFSQNLKRYLILGFFLYFQLFMVLLDIYVFTVIRSAIRKESIWECFLCLYLQISLLAHNVAEILIVAYQGIFDGSSMLLGARATVCAISIEMICLFLQEVQRKQDNDSVLFTKILLV